MAKKIESLVDLRTDDKNLNVHTQRGMGALEKSIQEVGYGDSMTADADGNILSGNGRAEIAAAVGMDDVIVVQSYGDKVIVHQRLDIEPGSEKAKRLAILSNRVSELNLEWDAAALLALEADGVKIDDVFNEQEMLDLKALADEQQAASEAPIEPANYELSGAFDEIPTDVETRVKPGEIWQLGRHKIGCLNSCDPEHIQALMGDAKPQMVWADPPYGISIVAANVSVGGGEANNIPFGGRKGNVGGSAAHIAKTGKPYIADRNKKGSVGGAKPFGSQKSKGHVGQGAPMNNMIDVGKYAPVIGDDTTETAIESYGIAAHLYPDAVHIWWGGNYYADHLPASSCWIVWDKQNTGNFADAELAWTNQKTAVRIFAHMWNGLMKASEKGVRRVHPTQKPVALAAWGYEKYGNEGDLIFDPFLGSGMSLIAADQTKRTVVGCEMSAEYCDIIISRWEAVSGHVAVKIGAVVIPEETGEADESDLDQSEEQTGTNGDDGNHESETPE